MSDSESKQIDVAGQSTAAEPRLALREALTELAAKLAAAGGAPFHMISMSWTTPDPVAFNPSLHDLDLCYREAFGGFRPPIAMVRSPSGPLVVQARAQIPQTAPAEPVWHAMAPAELARQYSPRGQVADMGALFARWSADGASFRRGRRDLDIAYGSTAFETLDVYRPDRAGLVPLWIFIHGGYWQASDKDQHAQFAAGMLDAGFAVANVNYGLCPDVPLSRIVGQVRSALWFLVEHAGRFGVAADAMHVAGHSAGGHLAAMMVTDRAAPPLRSALLLSGLYDLTPLSLLPVARITGLTTREAVAELSPLMQQPRAGTKVAVAVGGAESDEFKWQSTELARRWDLAPPLVIDGANHFALLDGLIEGSLLDCARRTAG
jgi:arylformamidase